MVACIILLCSCTSSKTLHKVATDSTQVNKVDSGSVKVNTGSEKKENDWWKETIVYPQARDCTINNYYNTTTPAVIIREGGSHKEESNYTAVDSSWKNSFDSLQAKVSETNKTSKSKVLSPWHLLFIGLGLLLGYDLLKRGLSRVKFSLR